MYVGVWARASLEVKVDAWKRFSSLYWACVSGRAQCAQFAILKNLLHLVPKPVFHSHQLRCVHREVHNPTRTRIIARCSVARKRRKKEKRKIFFPCFSLFTFIVFLTALHHLSRLEVISRSHHHLSKLSTTHFQGFSTSLPACLPPTVI